MKFRVSELDGARLDQAVAQACGYLYDAKIDEDFVVVALDPALPRPPDRHVRRSVCRIVVGPDGQPYTPKTAWAAGSSAKGSTHSFCPSSEWSHGGPIIEREGINVRVRRVFGLKSNSWWALMGLDNEWPSVGDSPLQAAMRAFVAHKLGDEVDL